MKRHKDVVQYKYELATVNRITPGEHLAKVCKFWGFKPASPGREWVHVEKNQLRELKLNGTGMIFHVANGKYVVWYQSANPSLGELEVAGVMYAIPGIRCIELIGATGLQSTYIIGEHERAKVRLYEGEGEGGGGDRSKNGSLVKLVVGRLGAQYGCPRYYEVKYARLEPSGRYDYPKVLVQTNEESIAKNVYSHALKDQTDHATISQGCRDN